MKTTPLTLTLLASLACGIKASPRPPLPPKPTSAGPSTTQPEPSPAPSQDCPGCPPSDGEKPVPQGKP